MAITAYTGLPRHGKSYGVVENVIVPALESGRIVYTNIPMKVDNCMERFGCAPVPFEMKDIQENPNWFQEVFEKGSILVLDEVWRLWASGLKANNALESHKSFLAEHGHMVGDSGHSTEVVLVTQDLSQVASFVRVLVNNTYRVTKLEEVGQDEKYRLDVYMGAVTGQFPPVSKRSREIFGVRKQEIYDLYVSQTMSDSGHGSEKRTDNRYNIMSGAKIKGVIGSLIFLVIFASFMGWKFLSETSLIEHDSDVSKTDLTTSQKIDELAKSKQPSQPVPSLAITPVPVQTLDIKKEIDDRGANLDLLSKSDSIMFMGYLTDNDNIKVRYYKLTIDTAYSYVKESEIIALGYDSTIINDCLTVFKGYNKTFYSLCKDNDSSNGLFTSIKSPL